MTIQLTDLLKELRIDYEDLTYDDTSFNPLLYSSTLSNPAGEESTKFRNIFHKINSVLINEVESKYDSFNSTLLNYKMLYSEYALLKKSIEEYKKSMEIILGNISTDFTAIEKERREQERENEIYKKLTILKRIYRKYKVFNKEFREISLSKDSIKTFIKNLHVHKEYLKFSLEAIDKYTLDENELIADLKRSIKRQKRDFVDFIIVQLNDNFIFGFMGLKSNTHNYLTDIHVAIMALKDFNKVDKLDLYIYENFQKSLFGKLYAITNRHNLEKLKAGSVKFSTFDFDRLRKGSSPKYIGDGSAMENELLTFISSVCVNFEVLRAKLDEVHLSFKFLQIEKIFSLFIKELKRIYSIKKMGFEESFNINQITDDINYSEISIFKRTVESKSEEEKIYYGEYKCKTSIEGIIKLWKRTSDKLRVLSNSHPSEEVKKQILQTKKGIFGRIISFTYKEIEDNLEEVNSELKDYTLRILDSKSGAFETDYYSNRLVFYIPLINKILPYMECIRFIEYNSILSRINERVREVFNLNRKKDLNIRSSTPYSQEDFEHLLSAILTLNDLYKFLQSNIKNIKSTLKSNEKEEPELYTLLQSLSMTYCDLKMKFKDEIYTVIFSLFDVYFTEGGYCSLIENKLLSTVLSFIPSLNILRRRERRLYLKDKLINKDFYSIKAHFKEEPKVKAVDNTLKRLSGTVDSMDLSSDKVRFLLAFDEYYFLGIFSGLDKYMRDNISSIFCKSPEEYKNVCRVLRVLDELLCTFQSTVLFEGSMESHIKLIKGIMK